MSNFDKEVNYLIGLLVVGIIIVLFLYTFKWGVDYGRSHLDYPIEQTQGSNFNG